MALAQRLQRRLKPSKSDVREGSSPTPPVDVEPRYGDSSDDDSDALDENSGDKRDDDRQDHYRSMIKDEALSGSPSPPSSPQQSLVHISFGALASAQASLGLKRKRSSQTELPHKRRSPSPFAEAHERLAGRKDYRLHPRPSKHAPTELSSKKAVSRKRSVVPTPTLVHRDPRFEPLSGPLDTNKLDMNYSFLNDYRTSEISVLKTSIRNAKDPAAKEVMKRQLLSMESREKARVAKERQQEVVREHRRREKEAVEKGKKPFYLKKVEQKKLALVKKFEGMGERKMEKVIERRRKKKASKERRGMPDGRRGAETSETA
ncbi:rRNA biogenesis protein rrp36 [Lambiella insularis]|nr:rRNA biogenesis protein rrp36 [Lambiella insularis]